MRKIVISGGGPAGILLASHLVQRPGYEVSVYEKFKDPMEWETPTTKEGGEDFRRSYPIALQSRAMSAIREISGLEGKTLAKYGKWIDTVCLHSTGTAKERKSSRKGAVGIEETKVNYKTPRVINRPPSFSIERNDLVRGFVSHLRENIDIHSSSSLELNFQCRIQRVNLQDQTVTIVKECQDNRQSEHLTYSETFDYIVAADGANSAIRQSLTLDGYMSFEKRIIPSYYKSLFLDTTKSSNGQHGTLFSLNSLHGSMGESGENIICVPVKDEYASGVYIFSAEKGKDDEPIETPFDDMTTPDEFIQYVSENQSPLLASMITQEEATAFLRRKPAKGWSVKCSTLSVKGKAVLIGDAAHAVSASLGQGCNSSLEDVQLLNKFLLEHEQENNSNSNWEKVLERFNIQRLPDAHAVTDLSFYANPVTLRQRITFIWRMVLKRILPKRIYNLFRPMPMEIISDNTMRYSEVLRRCYWWTGWVKKAMDKGK